MIGAWIFDGEGGIKAARKLAEQIVKSYAP